jgi:intracellular septation protein
MNPPILERDPSDPKKPEINPLLKLVLELGPLMVFFFANARGEWLVSSYPALCRSCRWSRASWSSSSAR